MYYLVGKVGARAGSGTAGLAKTHLFNFFYTQPGGAFWVRLGLFFGGGISKFLAAAFGQTVLFKYSTKHLNKLIFNNYSF